MKSREAIYKKKYTFRVIVMTPERCFIKSGD